MDEDVYFVDTRNAGDHRLPVRPPTVVRAPVASVVPTGTRVTYSPPPQQAMIYPAQYGTSFAPSFGPQVAPQFWGGGTPVYSAPPIFGQPGWMNQLGGLFGGLGLGDLIKLGAEAFAAFKSLPAAPAPTGDVGTDVANNVVYLTALAKDATDRRKFDYIGELATGLAGRVGWGLGGR